MILTDDFELGLGESDERSRPNYSVVLAKLDGRVGAHLRYIASQIPDHHLVGVGREPLPHITVLYGLHDHHPRGAQWAIGTEPPPRVKFGRVSAFTANPKFDVVKVDAESADLERLHKRLKYLPHTEKFSYKPHATVAYVKKGWGQHYADKLNGGVSKFNGYEHTFNSVQFSEPKARAMHQIDFRPKQKIDQVAERILAGESVDEMLTAAMVGTQPISGFGFVRPIFPSTSRRRNVSTRRLARV